MKVGDVDVWKAGISMPTCCLHSSRDGMSGKAGQGHSSSQALDVLLPPAACLRRFLLARTCKAQQLEAQAGPESVQTATAGLMVDVSDCTLTGQSKTLTCF